MQSPASQQRSLELGPEEPNNGALSELGLKVCTLGKVEESMIEGRGMLPIRSESVSRSVVSDSLGSHRL